jgi:hypothetical protein
LIALPSDVTEILIRNLQRYVEATNRAVQSALVAEHALGHFDAGRDWRREFAVVDTAFVAGLFRQCERLYNGEAFVHVAETGQRQLTAEMFTAYLRERMPEHAGIARRWMRDRPFDDPLVQLGFD